MCPGLCGQCRDVLCRDTGTYQNFHAVPCPLHQSAEKLRSLWGTRRLPAGEDGTKAHAPDRFQCRKGVGADIKGTVQGTRHRTACLFRCPARRRINGPHGIRIQLPFRGQHTGHDTICPSLHQLCGLEEGLTQRKRTLFLPESYGNYSDRASIYLTSAISGGSLRRRLEEAIDTYGPHRLVLCLRRARDDFFLPSVKGQGRPISQETLERLQRRLNPSVFFSPDLCAHYFTYMSRETGAHFILFDDGESLEKKRTLAQELGISRFFLLYPEIAEFLPRLVRQEA